ncbi:MAG: hypothetical protein KDA25_11880 [Phycisphaerales bacterium]|nr:hypothetical protein [Phycisphaerales bacterium]
MRPTHPDRPTCAPPLSWRLDVPSAGVDAAFFLRLPTTPGVFILLGDDDLVLTIGVTADLRRMIRTRLEPPAADAPSARVPYHHLTRAVLGTSVGSSFEADWVFLHLARRDAPRIYKGLIDRYQAWFVHCDPDADFPQWTKTPRPDERPGRFIGPFPDKHAAQRYITLLEDAFDLCRYHHVLVQAPHGRACAYKEMGRCPAPCDGSVPLSTYRAAIEASVEFALTPIDDWRARATDAMHAAAGATDFEAATRWRERLERTRPAAARAFRDVDDLRRCVSLAVGPAARRGWCTLLLVHVGRVVPLVSLAVDAPIEVRRAAWAAVVDRVETLDAEVGPVDPVAIEHLGLLNWHRTRPESKRTARDGKFLRVDRSDGAAALGRTMRALAEPAASGHEFPDRDLDLSEV